MSCDYIVGLGKLDVFDGRSDCELMAAESSTEEVVSVEQAPTAVSILRLFLLRWPYKFSLDANVYRFFTLSFARELFWPLLRLRRVSPTQRLCLVGVLPFR